MDLKQPALRWLRRIKRTPYQEKDLCQFKYDMKGINDRFHKAMFKTGKTRAEVAELFGMDPCIPLALQPPEKVPRPTMENIIRLSAFLGVSVRWILHGDPENDVDLFVSSGPGNQSGVMCSAASQGAAIISGANNSTVVVQNIKGDDLSATEREILQAFRAMSPRNQAVAMCFIFDLDSSSENEKAPSS